MIGVGGRGGEGVGGEGNARALEGGAGAGAGGEGLPGGQKENRVQEMAAEIEDLRMVIEGEGRRLSHGSGEMDECSSSLSQRFQGLIDTSSRSSLVKNARKRPKSIDIPPNREVQSPYLANIKEQDVKSQRPQQSCCHKEEISKPQTPIIPKPPSLPSSSNSPSISSTTTSSSSLESTARSRT